MRTFANLLVVLGFVTLASETTGQEPPSANVESQDVAVDEDAAPVSIHVAMVEFLSAGDVDVRAIGSPEQLDAWLKDLGDARKLLAVTKIDVSTVDGREVMTQFGERAAVVSGRTRIAQGRGGGRGGRAAFGAEDFAAAVASSYQMVEIGTIVRATPHLRDGDTMLVMLQIERSDISPLTPQIPAGDDGPVDVAPPSVVTISSQSALRLENGRTQLAYRKATSSAQGMVETVMFVTAVAE